MRILSAFVPATALLLSACGGGGGGSSSTPTTPPTTTPPTTTPPTTPPTTTPPTTTPPTTTPPTTTPPTTTPPTTPPPAAGNDGTLLNLQADQAFTTFSNYLAYGRAAVRLGTASSGALPPGNQFAFTGSNRAYTFRMEPGGGIRETFTATFEPVYLRPTDSDARFTVYRRNALPLSEYETVNLKLFNPGPTNDQLALTYSSVGIFNFEQGNNPTFFDYRPFAYLATATPASGIPTSGSATFNGIIVGRAAPPGGSNLTRLELIISGTAQITVNFADRSYSGVIAVTGTERESGTTFSLGNVSLSPRGTPALTTLSGTIDSGNFDGALAGPSAQELARAFLITINDPQTGTPLTLVAALAAKR